VAPLRTRSVEWAATSYTLPGQTETGDRHFIADIPEGTFVAVVDGLGHGPEAATAAERAVTAIDQSGQVGSLAEMFKRCHRALRGTRGVVMSLATYDAEKNEMTWLGVGNVIGRLHRFSPNGRSHHENLVLRSGAHGVYLSPYAFVQRPARWLRILTEYKAVSTVSPNFGLDHTVQRVKPAETDGIDLQLDWGFDLADMGLNTPGSLNFNVILAHLMSKKIQNLPGESFTDYVGRMKEGQDRIYYVTAESFLAAKGSPHLEIFRKRGIEVLLLSDRVDEWLVANLREFEGKPLVSVARAELGLEKIKADDATTDHEVGKYKDLLMGLKRALGDKVKDVRISQRLTESPSCLIADEHDIGGNLARILKAAGQKVPASKPILEINPGHALIKRLQPGDAQFGDWAGLLFDQALLAEGGQLEDPAGFVKRTNELMLSATR
jgi:hypothetical protein